MRSVHLERSFGQKKCCRKKVLLLIAKFSLMVWWVVNSDVGIIVIFQSFMVFLTELLTYLSLAVGSLGFWCCSMWPWRRNKWNSFFSSSVSFLELIYYNSHFILLYHDCCAIQITTTVLDSREGEYLWIPSEWNPLLLTVLLKSPFLLHLLNNVILCPAAKYWLC